MYSGVVELVDGGPYTSWGDYRYYRIEITDPNDADGDGIPDLTSVPEPTQALLYSFALATLALLKTRAV